MRLTNGEVLEGTFSGARDDEFGLWIEADDAARERHGRIRSYRRWIAFGDVAELSGGGVYHAEPGRAPAYGLYIGRTVPRSNRDGGERQRQDPGS